MCFAFSILFQIFLRSNSAHDPYVEENKCRLLSQCYVKDFQPKVMHGIVRQKVYLGGNSRDILFDS